jgi:hypothetical protein
MGCGRPISNGADCFDAAVSNDYPAPNHPFPETKHPFSERLSLMRKPRRAAAQRQRFSWDTIVDGYVAAAFEFVDDELSRTIAAEGEGGAT